MYSAEEGKCHWVIYSWEDSIISYFGFLGYDAINTGGHKVAGSRPNEVSDF
jgi:hypothetical protein